MLQEGRMPLSWQNPLAKFAALADFAEAKVPVLTGAPPLPSTAQLWSASYAYLLALPVSETTIDALRAAAPVGQEWLDLCCIEAERNDHRVMDAYLVLLNAETLPDTLFATVQEIELDPTACRKHVAWPLSGDDDDTVWHRLLRVTVLGLPTSPQASGMTNSPILDSELQKRLLRDVKALKGKPAARQHAENPDTDA
jgi:hypothetical protein